jgi:hypothetical protein
MGLTLSDTVSVNKASITRVEIMPDGKLIIVHLVLGFVDPATNNFVAVTGRMVEITGAFFDSLAQRLTTGKSFYEEIKTAIWEKLIEMGVVSGTIE